MGVVVKKKGMPLKGRKVLDSPLLVGRYYTDWLGVVTGWLLLTGWNTALLSISAAAVYTWK